MRRIARRTLLCGTADLLLGTVAQAFWHDCHTADSSRDSNSVFVPAGDFNVLVTGGAGERNADGSAGYHSWRQSVLQYWYNFPVDGEYLFTIPAFYALHGTGGADNLQLNLDGVPIMVDGGGGNGYWSVQEVTNIRPTQSYAFRGWAFGGYHSIVIQINGVVPGHESSTHIDGLWVKPTGRSFPVEPPGNRDPYVYPQSSYGYWNSALGSGAVWSDLSDPDQAMLSGIESWVINGDWFGAAFYEGQAIDPWCSICNSDTHLYPTGTGDYISYIRAPPQMLPSPGGSEDFELTVSDGTNPRYAWTGYPGIVQGQTVFFARGYVKDRYNGMNWGITGGMMDEGILRVEDLMQNPPAINHKLQYGLATQLLKAPPKNVVIPDGWPQTMADYNSVFGLYNGGPNAIPYGVTLGIPSNVSMPAGLTPEGQALFKALQNYGAMINMTGGEPVNQLTLYAVQDFDNYPRCQQAVANARKDFPTIGPLLRILRNSTPDTPNGGGWPLVPPLPGLTKNLPKRALYPPDPIPPQNLFALGIFQFGKTGQSFQTRTHAPPGSFLVFLAYICGTASQSILSIADQVGNSWEQAVQSPLSASVPGCAIFYCRNSRGIGQWQNITVNTTGDAHWGGVAYFATGMTGTVDVTATVNNHPSTGFALSLPTMSASNEMVVGALNSASAIGSSIGGRINHGHLNVELGANYTCADGGIAAPSSYGQRGTWWPSRSRSDGNWGPSWRSSPVVATSAVLAAFEFS